MSPLEGKSTLIIRFKFLGCGNSPTLLNFSNALRQCGKLGSFTGRQTW